VKVRGGQAIKKNGAQEEKKTEPREGVYLNASKTLKIPSTELQGGKTLGEICVGFGKCERGDTSLPNGSGDRNNFVGKRN